MPVLDSFQKHSSALLYLAFIFFKLLSIRNRHYFLNAALKCMLNTIKVFHQTNIMHCVCNQIHPQTKKLVCSSRSSLSQKN